MAKELAEKDYFTVENFKALNGEDYRSNDIRTYKMPPLASTPYADVYIHLCVPDAGSKGMSLVRTNQGNFTGNSFTETGTKAERSILNFPKASDIDTKNGVVKVEDKKLPSLYPSWMITRYGRGGLPENLVAHHVLPLFLDKHTKQFLMFFDEAFLREIDAKLLTEGVDQEHYKVYRGKNKERYLALTSYVCSDFYTVWNSHEKDNPINRAFSIIQDNYFRLTLDASNLEKVIVIDCEQQDTSRHAEAGISDTSMKLSFGKAARHGENYYWIDESGHINTQVSNVVQRNHAMRPLGGARLKDLLPRFSKGAKVVIPYTDEDWATLVKIKARMDEINRALLELIQGCRGEIGSSVDLRLSDSTAKSGATKLLLSDK